MFLEPVFDYQVPYKDQDDLDTGDIHEIITGKNCPCGDYIPVFIRVGLQRYTPADIKTGQRAD